MKFDSLFSIYRYWQHTEKRPGLYFFFSRFDNELLYIGKSTDIHRRLTQYTGSNNHLEHYGVFHNIGSVGVVYIDDKTNLEKSELKAIKHFNPPFNVTGNDGHSDKYNEKYKTGLQIEMERKRQEGINETFKDFRIG